MEVASPRIDIRSVRVHHAARVIAYYVSRGRTDYFLLPFIPFSESPVFNHWNEDKFESLPDYGKLVQWMLECWPIDRLETFFPYPVIRLMKRHSVQEQMTILNILRDYYGL